MREGSAEAKRELIEAHVGLAFTAAQEFDDDEALSDALFTLVQEVEAFRSTDKHPAALPSYLKTALGRAAAAHKRNRRHGKHGIGERHCAANDARRLAYSGRLAPEYSGAKLVDLMDQVLAACETEQERRMVYYRSLGMTHHEVALRVGCSYTHVASSMQRLELRFRVQQRFA